MAKYNLERFTGGRRSLELEDGATKGATVGVNLFYNGVLVRWEDIYSAPSTGSGVSVTDWSLILNIPAPITTLESLAGTGFVFVTSPTSYSVVSTTGAVAGSVPQFNGTTWGMGTALSNPMTTIGDIITADTGGVPQRLPVGADGDILTVQAGEPVWLPGGGGGNPRGITVTGGSIGGSVITAAQVIGGLSASDYTLSGNWYLWCSPTGSIEVDVRAAAFGSLPPGPGDSLCGGNEPAVSSGISASGTFAGWTTSINQNDALSVVVNSVTDVTWFVLLLEAT
jgi:hypothetical protein